MTSDVMSMREFLTIKTDRFNYEHFISGPKTLKVSRLGKKVDQGKPRLLVFFEGHEDTPYWVPLGMAKCIASPDGWGESPFADWVGRSMTLFGEPTVQYGGKELGGVRVSHLSHIEKPYTTKISIRRGVRIDYEILPLKVAASAATAEVVYYPESDFAEKLPAMLGFIKDGKMTLAQVVARCEQTGKLTEAQLKQLEGKA